jgi:PAS domain S-box-containing protein
MVIALLIFNGFSDLPAVWTPPFFSQPSNVTVYQIFLSVLIVLGIGVTMLQNGNPPRKLKKRKKSGYKEEWFSEFIQNIPSVAFIKDISGRYLEVNPQFERMFGLSRRQIIGKTDEEIFPREQAAAFRANDLKVLQAGVPLEFEETAQYYDGPHISIVSKFPLYDGSGTLYAIAGIATDITQRKRAEQESEFIQTLVREIAEAESLEEALRLTLRRICDVTHWALGQAWVLRADGTALECSPAYYCGSPSDPELEHFRTVSKQQIFAWGECLPGEVWSQKEPIWIKDVTEYPKFRRAPDAIKARIRSVMAVPVLANGGVLAVLEFFQREVREEDERLLKLVSTVAAQLGTVMKKKRIENALKETTYKLTTILDASPVAILSIDPAGKILTWNRGAERLFGWTEAEALGRFCPTVPDYAIEDFKRMIGRALSGETFSGHVAYRRKKSGEVIEASIACAPLRGSTGELLGIIAILEDITAHRKAEKALRESEERYRELVELSPDAIGITSGDTIIFINPAGARILGFEHPTDVIGRSFVPFVHPESQPLVQHRIKELLEGKKTPMTEIKVQRADGVVITIESEAVPTTYHGQPASLFIARDITERKKTEERLALYTQKLRILSRRLLEAQEAERVHIARELHDDVGQLLTSLRLSLELSARTCTDTAQTPLVSSLKIADELIDRVRGLSLSLRPAVLDDLGLIPAVRWYLDRQGQLAGVQMDFEFDFPQDRRPKKEIETVCFRIVQEAVTNIIRHAQARNVVVRFMHTDHALELLIRDDGVGFDVQAAKNAALQGRSLGLLSMEERVELVGGTLQIESIHHGWDNTSGTTIRAVIPGAFQQNNETPNQAR